MSTTRFGQSVVLACMAFAVALSGCTSKDDSGGLGGAEMALTLETPPGSNDEVINIITADWKCDGVDPFTGVPRPAETEAINVSTTEGDDPNDPKSRTGILSVRGQPVGPCDFDFVAYSEGTTDINTCNLTTNTCTEDGGTCANDGECADMPMPNVECRADDVIVDIHRDVNHQVLVTMVCIRLNQLGGADFDAQFEECPQIKQAVVSPTSQIQGGDIDVRVACYDPDTGDDCQVNVALDGGCSGTVTPGPQVIASCEDFAAGCTEAFFTVSSANAGPCDVTITVTDPGMVHCNGFLFPPNDTEPDTAATQTVSTNWQLPSTCGNGVIDAGEECDDGALNSDTLADACRTDCTDARCGDLVVDTGEECEPPNTSTCDASCLIVIPPGCGNGVIDAGEECDDGALNSDTLADACRTTCVLPSCGDAVTDTGESCDDAGESATCNADCSSSSCGDGIVNTTAGEECDDAANNSDTLADACRTSCLDASCGDSVVDTGEQCDPPDGGACSASCQDQAGCGDHLCSFTPAGGSNITLVSAILDLPLAANGSMNVNCDPNFPDTDGKCECAGEFVSVDQLTIPSIGIACLVPVPAAVCVNAGLLGNVDCDGGSDQDTSVTVDHNANISTSSAACTSHAECGAVCQPYCVGQGAIPSQALCGGYCQLSGASCVEDADCTGVGDTCVGPEFDATHTGECQCTCVELGDGNNDGPGDASLFAAFGLNVLTNAGQWGPDGIPCTLDDEPAITLPPQCAPFTTTSATTVVLNSGNSAGVTNPPGGPVTVTGAPFTCGGGVPTNASGTGIRAAASFLDSTLGDLSATITLNCE